MSLWDWSLVLILNGAIIVYGFGWAGFAVVAGGFVDVRDGHRFQ